MLALELAAILAMLQLQGAVNMIIPLHVAHEKLD